MNDRSARRAKKEWTSPEELRKLLKDELGLNRRQVSVSRKHSMRYLTLTVRDPSVALPEVENWAEQFNTWTMDATDYVEGQSVSVETTEAVNKAHGSPWMETVEALLPEIESGVPLISLARIREGLRLYAESDEVWLELGRERRCYHRRRHVLAREPWAIEALALDIARLLAKRSPESAAAPLPDNVVPFDPTDLDPSSDCT